MLILRRRAGESVLIGEKVEITVLETNERGVRLAIDAPREVSILRSELVQAVDANRDAASEQSRPEELLAMLGTMRKPPAEQAEQKEEGK